MSKVKSPVQRILDKIRGEKETAKKWIDKDTTDEEDMQYFFGKIRALQDLETWIRENIEEAKCQNES